MRDVLLETWAERERPVHATSLILAMMRVRGDFGSANHNAKQFAG